MVAALVLILGPMLSRGAGALVFDGTVEYRKMQYDMHGRGQRKPLETQLKNAAKARAEVYRLMDNFAVMVDTSKVQKQAKSIFRQFKIQLSNQVKNGTLAPEQARASSFIEVCRQGIAK